MRHGGLRGLALVVALLAAPAARAQEPPRFSLPLDCDFARVCYVQNYVDLDPGPGFADPTCGPLGYDGDRGTDLAAPTLAWLRAGLPVVAAADGVVEAVRDGEPDNLDLDFDPAAIRGREAGNAVLVDHGGGWEAQYNHLRRGSVVVRPGEQVRRGQRLGLMGLSGRTQFPHLEFAVRHRGRAIDPFTGRPAGGGCGPGGSGRWTDAAAEALAYRPGGLLALGLAPSRPDLLAALRGDYREPPGRAAPALVAWAVAWGLQAGDREELILTDPAGRVVVDRRETVPGNKARWLSFAGRPTPDGGWPRGPYRIDYRVERQGRTVIEARQTLELR